MNYRQLVTTDGQNYFLKEHQLPDLGAHDVRGRVEFAAPKHGRETHLLGGSVFDRKNWNEELRMFLPKSEAALQDEAQHSVSPDAQTERSVGNMVVGEVLEIGTEVSRFAIGDAVFGYGPVAEIHQAPQHEWFPLNGLTTTDAVCVHPAHVAFVAVRDGNIASAMPSRFLSWVPSV